MMSDWAKAKPGFRVGVNDARGSDIWKPILANQSVIRRRLAQEQVMSSHIIAEDSAFRARPASR